MTPFYQDDLVAIYHGDCREILPQLSRFDLVLTDPPYGIKLRNNAGNGMKNWKRTRRDYTVAGDESMEAGKFVSEWAKEQGLPLCMFASPKKPWPGEWRSWLAWDKGGWVGGGGDTSLCWKQSWELIQIARNPMMNGGRDSSVLRFPVSPHETTLHPTQKPIALLHYLVQKLTEPGQSVIDPFMGSGTTLRAAKDLGRKAVGIDIEERHCETTAKRLSQETIQEAIVRRNTARGASGGAE